MKKNEIERRALGGLLVYSGDVCRVSRDKRRVTLRHVWPGETDGRIWDAVRRAYLRLAQKMADKQKKPIAVYDRQGNFLYQVEPQR